jgi:hypothetical protein
MRNLVLRNRIEHNFLGHFAHNSEHFVIIGKPMYYNQYCFPDCRNEVNEVVLMYMTTQIAAGMSYLGNYFHNLKNNLKIFFWGGPFC